MRIEIRRGDITTLEVEAVVNAANSTLLASCYRESLREAARLGARSVAFPAISAGVYGWPMEDATRIAVETVRAREEELGESIEEVLLVPFDDAAKAGYRRALG